jgi:preprotein translocase subunit SecG
MDYILMVLLIFTAIFLIILVLVQRGKGGGLAGAFGGMGGQSAFGTKAGDLFTKITIGVAAVWILLCIMSVRLLGTHKGPLNSGLGGANPPARQTAPASTEKQPPVTTEKPSGEIPAIPSKSQ